MKRSRAYKLLIDGCKVLLNEGERNLFMVLYNARRRMSRIEVHEALYSHRADGGPTENQVSVYVWRLRKKLEPTRFRIRSMRGSINVGYSLYRVPGIELPALSDLRNCYGSWKRSEESAAG